MSAFSHTQPIFTKEQEDKEQASLTNAEKKAIEDDLRGSLLDDVAAPPTVDKNKEKEEDKEKGNKGGGTSTDKKITDDQHIPKKQKKNPTVEDDNCTDITNNHNNSGSNEDHDDDTSDITPKLLEEFTIAMDRIPLNDKIDYMNALTKNESLFETECNPIRFLRCNYNPDLAAKQMAKYWSMRVQVFGSTRAFLPMTLNGALFDDIENLKSTKQNIFYILPNDIKGRTVLCFERKNTVGIKTYIVIRLFWYTVHLALQRGGRFTEIHGIVMISNSHGITKIDQCNRIIAKLVVQSIKSTLPVKVCAIHSYSTSLVSKLFIPAVRFLMNKYLRTRHVLHKSELAGSELIRELQSYGLLKDPLPKNLGGTHEVGNWVIECMENEGIYVNDEKPGQEIEN